MGGCKNRVLELCYAPISQPIHADIVKRWEEMKYQVYGKAVFDEVQESNDEASLQAHLDDIKAPSSLLCHFNGNVNPKLYELSSGTLKQVPFDEGKRAANQQYKIMDIETMTMSQNDLTVSTVHEHALGSVQIQSYKQVPIPPDGNLGMYMCIYIYVSCLKPVYSLYCVFFHVCVYIYVYIHKIHEMFI